MCPEPLAAKRKTSVPLALCPRSSWRSGRAPGGSEANPGAACQILLSAVFSYVSRDRHGRRARISSTVSLFWTPSSHVCTLYIVKVRFVWDEVKNAENFKKHGVDFAEASSVFDRLPLEIFHDPDHSIAEHRYIALGFSANGRALFVSHTENATGTEIRIISARKATKKERTEAFGG